MNTPRVSANGRDSARPHKARRIRRMLDARDVAEVRRLRDEEGLGPAALSLRSGVGLITIAAILNGRYRG